MLELTNIQISRGNLTLAGDLTLQAGKKIGIIGPSGAGKSTLLAIIAGFLPLKKGAIGWQGQNISHLQPAQRPIAILQQSHNLFTHLSIRDNISLGFQANLKLSKAEKEQIDVLIEALGITEIANHLPREISGGQAARAALARIMVQNKDIILMDEPFSALGPAQRQDILHHIDLKLHSESRIILCIAHQIEDLIGWVDQLVWINDGQITLPQNIHSFFKNPSKDVKSYLGDTIFNIRKTNN